MIIKIKRQTSPDSSPYWQTFRLNMEKESKIVTVQHILERLNLDDDLFDIEGKPARRIKWECSCQQKICGACAMRINNKPALACSTFIDIEVTDNLVLEPLSKFPVIVDLCVDRSIIQEHLLEGKVFYQSEATYDARYRENRYNLSKCLKCGLCLEACPNYSGGSRFFGAIFANDAYMIQTGDKSNKEIKKQYNKHFARGCSKSLACVDVCPMNMPTLSSIAGMNRM